MNAKDEDDNACRDASSGLEEFSVSSRSTSCDEIEKDLQAMWCHILNQSPRGISMEADFFALGGHSVALAKMLSLVKNAFGAHVKLTRFLESPCIQSLAKEIISARTDDGISKLQESTKEIEMIKRDARLPACVNVLPNAPKAKLRSPDYVFITGATGFLGVYLVDQLLTHTTASTIHCHVRAQSVEEAWQRLEQNAAFYQLDHIGHRNKRIRVVNGDLNRPLLGLSLDAYNELCEKVDCIFHCGAFVHHVFGYQQLRGANVLSTIDLLRMACSVKNKGLVYISTVAAVIEKDPFTGMIVERVSEFIPRESGYSQSKWASEQLVAQAAGRGVNTIVCRPGNITGDTKHGLSNACSNHINLLVKGCLEMGVFPDWNDDEMEMTPVDILAEGIVKLSQHRDAVEGDFYNMNNPNKIRFKDYVEVLASSAYPGYTPVYIPDSEWRKEHVSSLDESNSMFSLCMLYPCADRRGSASGPDDTKVFTSLHETNKCQTRLKQCGVSHPKRFRYLISLYGRAVGDVWNVETLGEGEAANVRIT